MSGPFSLSCFAKCNLSHRKSTKGNRLQMESDHQCWTCCQMPIDGIFHLFTVKFTCLDALCQRNIAVPGCYILLGISAPWRKCLPTYSTLSFLASWMRFSCCLYVNVWFCRMSAVAFMCYIFIKLFHFIFYIYMYVYIKSVMLH